MPQRLATIVALLAFAVCLCVGGLQVGNPFTTTVGRALAAMAGTYVVGLIVGAMGRRAIEENLAVAPAPPVPTPPPAEPAPAVKPKAGGGR